MASQAGRQERPRNSDVYDRLRAMAVGGGFEPGARIRIEVLAATLGAGRTPLREALFQLSTEHLVEFRYQTGFWTPHIDAADLAHLVGTKSALEAMLLSDPSAERGEEWERRLLLAFHDLGKAAPFAPEGDFAENRPWLEAHRAFHRALVEGSENGWAMRLADITDANIDRYRSFILGARIAGSEAATARLKGEIEKLNALDEHRRLYELALARDMKGLAGALGRHNAGALSMFRAWLALRLATEQPDG